MPTPTRPADPADLTADPRSAVVVRSLARLARTVEKTCQDADISLAQYRLMLFVAHEPQRAGELATKTSVSRPTLTNLVNGLERQGLLRRVEVAADRRGVRLELTEQGREVLARTERTLVARIVTLLGDVEDTERLLEAFTDLGRALDLDLDRRLAGADGGDRAER